MPLSRSKDLHGAAPDKCPLALLLIDWINDLEFDGAASEDEADNRHALEHMAKVCKARLQKAA